MSGTATPLSLNEIDFYFTRAAVGAGAPFGIGEELAEASKCLAYLGLDPAAAAVPALHALARGDSGTSLSLHAGAAAIRLRSSDGRVLSALFAGPAVADRLSIEAESGKERRLRLDDTDQPVLIVAAIAAAGVDATGIAVSWHAADGRRIAVELAGGNAAIAGLREADVAMPDPAPVEVVLNGAAGRAGPAAHAETKRLAEGRRRAVEHGVEVDDAARSTVMEYFGKCLVPTTAQSRGAGAGAGGLTDSD